MKTIIFAILLLPVSSMAATVFYSGTPSITIDAGTMTITGTDATKVLKAGDTMTGALSGTNISLSGTLDVTGNTHIGTALGAYLSTFTAASGNFDAGGAITSVGAISAGSTLSAATTSALKGNVYIGATGGAYLSTFTVSSGNLDVAGIVKATSFSGAGTGITAVPAANIAAGSLGGSVIASSVAVSAVQDVSIVAVSASKLTGALPLALLTYVSSDCEALTPAAEGEFCYDSTLHVMNASTSTAAGGFSPL